MTKYDQAPTRDKHNEKYERGKAELINILRKRRTMQMKKEIGKIFGMILGQ